MDLTKLTRGDQVISVSAIVLFIFSFFDWFGVDLGPYSAGGNAWDFTLCWFAVILGLAMLAQVLLTKLGGVKLPDLGNITWGQVLCGLGALAFVLVLIKMIVGVDTEGFDIDIDRKIGIFVGLIATAGLAVGGYLKMQEGKAGAPGTA